MVKKVKGLKVEKQLVEKFKFTSEGDSQIGTDSADSHAVTGTMATAGTLELTGDLVLDQRISDALFGVPQIDGETGTASLQELITNIDDYEGFMVYLTNPGANPVAPFLKSEKFYFCENGEWHPSPFVKEGQAADADGDGVADDIDPFVTETTAGGETNTVFTANSIPANDPIFDQDSTGNILITAAAAGETNGNFEVDANGNIVLIA
tara:strand:- start:363 stop:986 length:624 start_codon:yes stop_codon:yes gene_type:complete